MLWNLLTNAIRFTPAGGVVQLALARQGDSVLISVADNGQGIGAEHLPFIFDRFQQVDGSTTRAHGGLGLGLAIVRHIVEAHGGAVSAKSAGMGCGTTFEVVLPTHAPYATRAEGSPVADQTLRGAVPSARSLHGRRILVVDDESDSLDMLCVILEAAGATWTAASNAVDALEVSARSEFDLIISDIGMPRMDGYAFMEQLRARGTGAPAVALTAYARSEDGQRARAAGFDDHLAKPVDADLLLATLENLLARAT